LWKFVLAKDQNPQAEESVCRLDAASFLYLESGPMTVF
jgi:hypothetical protein